VGAVYSAYVGGVQHSTAGIALPAQEQLREGGWLEDSQRGWVATRHSSGPRKQQIPMRTSVCCVALDMVDSRLIDAAMPAVGALLNMPSQVFVLVQAFSTYTLRLPGSRAAAPGAAVHCCSHGPGLVIYQSVPNYVCKCGDA
jgi:hypothetical protein